MSLTEHKTFKWFPLCQTFPPVFLLFYLNTFDLLTVFSKFFAVYRIFKDELWSPDLCDFTWQEAVQVDVILQVLNKLGNGERTNTR